MNLGKPTIQHLYGRISATLGLLMLLGLPLSAQAAGTSHLSLSPNSGTLKKGDSVVITVKETSTDPVNAVAAYLDYDPAVLQYVSYDKSTGAFSDSNTSFFLASNSSGHVNLSGAVLGGSTFTGDQTVATVSFTVLAGSGSSSIVFDDNNTSDIENNGISSWDHITAGATFSYSGNVITATTTSPTSPPPTTTKTSGGKTTTTAPPVTKQPVPPTNLSTSTSATASSPSYFVLIKVLDSKRNPISGASVTIDGQTVTTVKGQANFNHVKAGPHTADVTYGHKHLSQSITVAPATSGLAVQQFTVVFGTNTSTWLWVAAVILIIIAISGGGLMLGRALIRRPNLSQAPPVARVAAAPGGATVAPPVMTAPPVASSSDSTPVGQIFYPDPNIQSLTPQPPKDAKDS